FGGDLLKSTTARFQIGSEMSRPRGCQCDREHCGSLSSKCRHHSDYCRCVQYKYGPERKLLDCQARRAVPQLLSDLHRFRFDLMSGARSRSTTMQAHIALTSVAVSNDLVLFVVPPDARAVSTIEASRLPISLIERKP